jgi:hypothetical protein
MTNISLLRILSVAVLVLFLVLFWPRLNYPAQAPYCHVTLATGTSPTDKLLQDFHCSRSAVPCRSIKISAVEAK